MLSPIFSVVLPVLMAVSPSIAPHPHNPKGLVVGGAGGKVTVTYFTVPYNPDQLAKARPGMSWHLGFAAFETEVPLRAGDTDIPAGKYKLNSQLSEDGKEWHIQLTSWEVIDAQRKLRSAQRNARNGSVAAKERVEELKATVEELTKKHEGGIVIAASDYESPDDEHLQMTLVNRGFNTVNRGSSEPAGGVDFSLLVAFGGLHRSIDLSEVFTPPAKSKKSDGE